MLNIKLNENDPYAKQIREFTMKEFPSIFTCNKIELLDIITDMIIHTGRTRFGPIPSIESLFAMRQVINHYIEIEQPIPFMVPWGSEKPDGSGIDVAELMAIKTLKSLHDRVTDHYIPGVQFGLRIEDLSAPYQFYHRMNKAREEAKRYTDGLVNLVKTTATDGFIFPLPDSKYGITEDQLNTTAELYRPSVEAHLKDPTSDEKWHKLRSFGWDAPISKLTIAHYMEGYAKLYPQADEETKFHVLARYFAASLARSRLQLTGTLPSWNKIYLELYFGKTPPGLVASRYLKRIHYRTMPSNITNIHMAPWRAKGFLRISDNGISASLASWNESKDYNPFHITLENNTISQEVQADYIIITDENRDK